MKGIMYSKELLPLVFSGQKTVTRRVINPQPIKVVTELKEHSGVKGYWIPYTSDNRLVNNNAGSRKNDCGYYPRYHAGEIVYVKEAHYLYGHWLKNGLTKTSKQKWVFEALNNGVNIRYLDNPPNHICKEKTETGYFKRTPLFLPVWAARKYQKVLSVRAERLQEITEEDAKKEGASTFPWWDGEHTLSKEPVIAPNFPSCYLNGFAKLWDSINSKRGYSWKSNPWLFRYEMQLVEKPE